MTRGAKGRLAVVGLVLVVMAFVVALATTRGARVRFWAWRMRSGERDVRREARTRLMEVGRPDIDPVFADLVAGEVADRLAAFPASERVAFVGRLDEARTAKAEPWDPRVSWYGVRASLASSRVTFTLVLRDDFPNDFLNVKLGPAREAAALTLIAGSAPGPGDMVRRRLEVPLAEDDPLLPAVIDATRARLQALK